MSDEDLFRFVPVDGGLYDDSRSDVLLLEPELKSKYDGKFVGIIKTGDKCVPHSKSNPKQRRGIANISNVWATEDYTYPAGADRILWSDETVNVVQLAQRSADEFPMVIKVAAERSNSSEPELSVGQNILVHSSGSEQRIAAYDVTSSKRLEIPRDLEISVLHGGRRLPLKEVTCHSSSPVKVKVVECKCQVDNLHGHVLILKGEVPSRFIVCSKVSAGWIDQSGLLVIPEATGLKFNVGEGLRGGGKEEWSDFVGMLRRSVRHQLDHTVAGYSDIITQDVDLDELSSSNQQSTERLPCYENVEIDLITTITTTITTNTTTTTTNNNNNNNNNNDDDNNDTSIPIYENFATTQKEMKDREDRKKDVKPDNPSGSGKHQPGDVRGITISTASLQKQTPNDQQNGVIRKDSRVEKATPSSPDDTQTSSKTKSSPSQHFYSKLQVAPNKHGAFNFKSPPKTKPTNPKLISATNKTSAFQTSPPTTTTSSSSSTTGGAAATTTATTASTTTTAAASTTATTTTNPHITSTSDGLPDKVDGLSCSEVERCLETLGMGRYCKGGWSVDGKTLSDMNAKEMETKLGVTPFEASKLVRFVRGWRP